METLYLASGFAFLVFFEKPASLRASETEQVFFSLIRQSAEIFFAVLLLVFFEGIFEKGIPSSYPAEGRVPFLVLVSYAASRILKKENSFFLTLLAFGFFVSSPQAGMGFAETVRRLGVMTLMFTAVRFALEGLRFRLLFAAPPKRLAGMPVLIFAFSIFLMALSALIPRP